MGAYLKSITKMTVPGNPPLNSPPEKEKNTSPKAGIVRKFVIPAVTILLVIVISVVLYLFRHEIEGLKQYAYLGVFVVSLLSSATVVVPVPGIAVFIPLLVTLNPVWVGVIGAAGSIIGELTGYAAGYSGRDLASRGKFYQRVEGWMQKRGGLIIFLFAFVPVFPLDVAGIVAGALRYPLWKFMLIAWVGKTLKYVALMLGAAWGVHWIMPWIDRFMG
jgi:membrane protein YqaA with SNARE-associated domain